MPETLVEDKLCTYRYIMGPKKGQVCNAKITTWNTHTYCEKHYYQPDVVNKRTLYSRL